jgi:hypothetical protein
MKNILIVQFKKNIINKTNNIINIIKENINYLFFAIFYAKEAYINYLFVKLTFF